MADVFCAVAGHAVASLHATIPNKGAWIVDAELGASVSLSGRAEIAIGSLKLSGTVDPQHSGTFGQTTKVRVVAGAGAWGNTLKPKAYHNDARVKAKTVAEDAAREVGETLGSFVPVAERVGADYVRTAVAASLVLESVIGAVPWWVDYAGKTNVGLRATKKPGAYQLVSFDPLTHVATLAVDDPATVEIGAVLEDSRLGASQTVRQLEIVVQGEELRIRAWCVQDGSVAARLADALGAIARQATGGRLFGLYRYRVVQMASDKVNLQAISKAAGLPDILPVAMHPGLAGAHSELTPGTEVLVQFVEGSPTMPILTNFGGKGDTGASPSKTTIDATSEIKLGASATKGIARHGDSVTVLLPPAVFSGQITYLGVPCPATGMVVWAPGQTIGNITVCSNKAKAE